MSARQEPAGPALVSLATDTRHYLRADEALVRDGLLVVHVAGRWQAYPPAALHKVVWIEPSEEQAA